MLDDTAIRGGSVWWVKWNTVDSGAFFYRNQRATSIEVTKSGKNDYECHRQEGNGDGKDDDVIPGK